MAFVLAETLLLQDGARLTTRSARQGDGPGIAALVGTLLRDGAGQIADPGELTLSDPEGWLEDLREQDNGLALLALHHDRVVGMVDVHGYSQRRQAHSAWMAIGLHPAWRRRGLGRLLLQRTLAWARHHATLELLTLHVRGDNPHAIRLYESLGFQVTGRTPRAIREGPGHYIDDVSMGRWVGD